MNELKSCPFCSSQDLTVKNNAFLHQAVSGKAWDVECNNCGSRTGHYNTKNEAIIAWNTRAGCRWINDLRMLVLDMMDHETDVIVKYWGRKIQQVMAEKGYDPPKEIVAASVPALPSTKEKLP